MRKVRGTVGSVLLWMIFFLILIYRPHYFLSSTSLNIYLLLVTWETADSQNSHKITIGVEIYTGLVKGKKFPDLTRFIWNVIWNYSTRSSLLTSLQCLWIQWLWACELHNGKNSFTEATQNLFCLFLDIVD